MPITMPTELTITITQELVQAAGQYTDPVECPLAIVLKRIFAGISEEVLLADVGIKHFWMKTQEGIYKYVLKDIFAEDEYKAVKAGQLVFETDALLAERPFILNHSII